MLGKKGLAKSDGLKRVSSRPRSSKFGDGSGKRKLENKDAPFATPKPAIPTRPGTAFRNREADSQKELSLFSQCRLSHCLGRVGSRGASPGGRAEGGRTAAPGKPLPTGSRHPLVVSAHGRDAGPGVAPRGARSLAPHPGTRQPSQGNHPESWDLFLQPQDSQGWAPLLGVGSPCPPHLLNAGKAIM